jgi:dipeptidyl aminopeptidase/acylaminoacyl peptidase
MNRDQHLDVLLSLPRAYNPIVSFDGKWVAWTALGVGDAADVYAAPTDGTSAPVRLTDTPELTMLVSWTPDSRAVLVQQDQGGNERYQLFRVDVDTPGVLLPLTEAAPNYFLRGGQLHPNGSWLIYAANFDCNTNEEIEPSWVYRHDLETGERRPLACPRQGGYYVPQMNVQGTHILYTRKDLHPSGQQVWMVDIEGRQDREILNFGEDVKAYASWFPDGHRVLVIGETPTHKRVGMWNRLDEQLRWVLDDPTRNVETAFVPYRSEQAVIVEVRAARVKASLLNVDTNEETPLESDGNLIPVAPLDGGEWVVQHYSARQPINLVRTHLLGIQPERSSSLNRIWDQTPLGPEDLTPAEDFRWRSVDGMEIQGWLYRASGQPRGTIVYVHGGPTSHSEDRFLAEIQFYASQGFNVLDPNYRGSTGFSQEFKEAIKVDGWGGREQDDIRAGIESLIRAGIAEPGKVGITGTSYGGYSSWCAITRWPPDIIAAAAPVCGMTDLVVDYHSTRPDLRPYSEEMLGGSPDQVPDRYYERSPINFVGNIKGRLLIVQGLQDPNVTPENVSAVEAALQREGVSYDLLTFDDEGHGVFRPKNRKVLYIRLVDLFAEAFAASNSV